MSQGPALERRVSLVTLGVEDLPRAVAFYEKTLGWTKTGDQEGVAFFDLNGFVLSLFPHAELAKDAGVPRAPATGFRGFSLAYNARSKKEVDAIFARLILAGAVIVKNPQTAFWGGYSGYFSDPDGNLWEVAHNPFWTVKADGRVALTPPEETAAAEAAAPASPAVAAAGAEAAKGFNPISAIYYFGAVLILSAFGWFLGSQWASLGNGGVLAVSVLYAVLFGYIAKFLIEQESYPVAGGLLATCAVGMTPLIVYSLEALLGLWPSRDPGGYHGYYVWVNGSWIVIELATVAASALAARRVRFPFLVMPAAIALWFLSMDGAEILFGRSLEWATRSQVSIVSGALFLAGGRVSEKNSGGVDFAFWIYLAGLLAFWGGLTSLPDSGEFGKLLYAGVNVALIAAGLYLNRRTFAVFGSMGVFGYIGHLAWSLFKDSPLFPIALAMTGLAMILLTVAFQKNYARLSAAVRGK